LNKIKEVSHIIADPNVEQSLVLLNKDENELCSSNETSAQFEQLCLSNQQNDIINFGQRCIQKRTQQDLVEN
jgi:hypothetical protein